tara:strand:- start:264 stop:653 length:390 start_codon:yes stop_codon:yes gene_type:complete
MSTIKTDNLQNVSGTASVPVNTVVNGSAKAWVNFNGTGTVAIRASFNVSSISDLGSGNYTVNFTSAMADANYVVLPHCPSYAGNDINRYLMVHGTNGVPTLQSASQVRLVHGYSNQVSDVNTGYVAIFR